MVSKSSLMSAHKMLQYNSQVNVNLYSVFACQLLVTHLVIDIEIAQFHLIPGLR